MIDLEFWPMNSRSVTLEVFTIRSLSIMTQAFPSDFLIFSPCFATRFLDFLGSPAHIEVMTEASTRSNLNAQPPLVEEELMTQVGGLDGWNGGTVEVLRYHSYYPVVRKERFGSFGGFSFSTYSLFNGEPRSYLEFPNLTLFDEF